MLQQLRDQTQSTGFKVLVIAIIAVLVLFGFGATNVFSGGDPEVAEVGSFAITERVLGVETERERRRILGQMGPDFDPNDIDRLQLQQFALSQLINRQVLYQTAANLGLKVSAKAVNHELLQNPAYQRDGEFDEALYLQQVQMLGYRPEEFMQEYASAMGSNRLRGGIQSSALVADWEVAEVYSVLEQRRDVAYLPLLIADYANSVSVSDEEIAARYDADQSAYMKERSVDVEYLEFSVAAIAATSNVEIGEEELRLMYESDRDAALQTTERDSAHILFEVSSGRDDGATLDLARSVKERIDAGEDFAELAKELSDDLGSAATGGALGLSGKGVFDPMFEQALWALAKPNDVSEPIRTEFGYHLIKLVGISGAAYPSFALERDALIQRLRREAALDAFAELQEEIERSAYDERYALSETASTFALSLRRVDGVSQSGEVSEDAQVLNADMVKAALFSDELIEGENSSVINLDDETSIVVRVAQNYPSEAIPLEQVRSQISGEVRREKSLNLIDEAKADALSKLEQGEGVSQVASGLGKRWTTLDSVNRTQGDDEVAREVIQHAFTLPRPAENGRSVGSVLLTNGSSAVVAVTRVVMGDISSASDEEREQLHQALARRNSQAEFAAFYQGAEEFVGVTRSVQF
ncbi:MAG TPA: hypothetical protein DHU16_07025 [Gammaproteobacteria bacterium]|nr:hypothetical protein [Gammaproteobacteria bacterium]